ncbi:MAG TPA: efflux RND transporter permease subunit [Sediminispirochaeta sp.]|nr:efflux RND transporter permease subunit [Sediminispirochaeta sp.]
MKEFLWGLVIFAIFSIPGLRLEDFDPKASTWSSVEVEAPGLEADYLGEKSLQVLAKHLSRSGRLIWLFGAALPGRLLFVLQHPAGIDRTALRSELHRICLAVEEELPYQAEPANIRLLPNVKSKLLIAFTRGTPGNSVPEAGLDVLRESLALLPGIQSIEIEGFARKEVRVDLQAEVLREMRISPLSLRHSLAAELGSYNIGVWDEGGSRREVSAGQDIDSLSDLKSLYLLHPVEKHRSFSLAEAADIEVASSPAASSVKLGTRRGYLMTIRFSPRSSFVEKLGVRRKIQSTIERTESPSKLYFLHDSLDRSLLLLAAALFALTVGVLSFFPPRWGLPFFAGTAGIIVYHRLTGLAFGPSSLLALPGSLFLSSLLLHYLEGEKNIHRGLIPLAAIFVSAVLLTWLDFDFRFSLILPAILQHLGAILPCVALAGPRCRRPLEPYDQRVSTSGRIEALLIFCISLSFLLDLCIYHQSHYQRRVELEASSPFEGGRDSIQITHRGFEGRKDPSQIPRWASVFSPQSREWFIKFRAPWNRDEADRLSLDLPPYRDLERLSDLIRLVSSQPELPRLREYELVRPLPLDHLPPGINRKIVFEHLRLLHSGVEVGEIQLRPGGNPVPVRVFLRRDDLDHPDELPIFSADGSSTLLSELARLEIRKMEAVIFLERGGTDR